MAAGFPACTQNPSRPTISLRNLVSAPRLDGVTTNRCMALNAEALRPLSQPFGERIALIQVRNRRDWEQLSQAVADIGPCPDLGRGIVIGLASQAGTPLDGRWPFALDAVRVHQGAGLIEARFHGGTYLPDGTTYLETAYVEGLSAVLVVAVDGQRYYPE